MFPFHRKHGNAPGNSKQHSKPRSPARNEDDMSEEEYLEYIHSRDVSRHQSTSAAHDRYCNTILREKEEILLSGLSSSDINEVLNSELSNNVRLGPNNNELFKCLLPYGTDSSKELKNTSLSLPSSPTNEDMLLIDEIYRRNSDSSAMELSPNSIFPEIENAQNNANSLFLQAQNSDSGTDSVFQHAQYVQNNSDNILQQTQYAQNNSNSILQPTQINNSIILQSTQINSNIVLQPAQINNNIVIQPTQDDKTDTNSMLQQTQYARNISDNILQQTQYARNNNDNILQQTQYARNNTNSILQQTEHDKNDSNIIFQQIPYFKNNGDNVLLQTQYAQNNINNVLQPTQNNSNIVLQPTPDNKSDTNSILQQTECARNNGDNILQQIQYAPNNTNSPLQPAQNDSDTNSAFEQTQYARNRIFEPTENGQTDYLLTLKIDDTESNSGNSKILLYRILPPKTNGAVSQTQADNGTDDDDDKYVVINATVMDANSTEDHEETNEIIIDNDVDGIREDKGVHIEHNYAIKSTNTADKPVEQPKSSEQQNVGATINAQSSSESSVRNENQAKPSTSSRTKSVTTQSSSNVLVDLATPMDHQPSSIDEKCIKIKNPTRVETVNGSIDLETSMKLKSLLLGKPTKRFSHQWLEQNFTFNSNVNKWQLVQLKDGCCGVVASVQAFIIKALLFDPGFSKCREPLRPTRIELLDSLINALSSILWKAGEYQHAVLITPPNARKITRDKSDGYIYDGITDSFTYTTYNDFYNLRDSMMRNLKVFTSPPNHGYLYFLVCIILTRGIERIKCDMNDDKMPLISENGHCSLELVMLLITGHAASNTFDNAMSVDTNLIKGITNRSEIGFLSSYEYLNHCEVIPFLKTPEYPIWIVSYLNHFTIVYSSKKETANEDVSQPFVLHHYDSLTCYENCAEINLIVDPQSNFMKAKANENLTDLQLCVKTKWSNGIILYTDSSELFPI